MAWGRVKRLHSTTHMKPPFTLCLRVVLHVALLRAPVGLTRAEQKDEAPEFRTPHAPNGGSLVLGPDGYFWGATQGGGIKEGGTIYKVKSDGSDFTHVLSFTGNGPSNKGSGPRAGLVNDGKGFLWGTTYEGGHSDQGTLFKVNASTGVLTTVVEFSQDGTANKGYHPLAELVSDGKGSFWGSTNSSGGEFSWGTIFKVDISTGVLTTVVEFTKNGPLNRGCRPRGGLLDDGQGSFWGTTEGDYSPMIVRHSWDEAESYGTVFKVDATSGVLTTVVEFTDNGAANKGCTPMAGLANDGKGSFWGTTNGGGANGTGTVFKVNAATGVLTTVIEFAARTAKSNPSFPEARLVNDGQGFLWGTTSDANFGFGSGNDNGTVFKINISTGTLTTVWKFGEGSILYQGTTPLAGLVSDGSGSFLGTTVSGGEGGGTVFKVNATTGALSILVWFDKPGR